MATKSDFAWKRQWDDSLNFSIPTIDTKAFPIATPLQDWEMDWVSRRYTPCQILRELYHAIDDPVLKMKCRVASNMTKVMATKISQYEPDWGKFTWPWREKKEVG